MISAEALFNGSRWRLHETPGGTFTVSRLTGRGWDPIYSGVGGIDGVRDAAESIRGISGPGAEGAELLDALADVAESGRAA